MLYCRSRSGPCAALHVSWAASCPFFHILWPPPSCLLLVLLLPFLSLAQRIFKNIPEGDHLKCSTLARMPPLQGNSLSSRESRSIPFLSVFIGTAPTPLRVSSAPEASDREASKSMEVLRSGLWTWARSHLESWVLVYSLRVANSEMETSHISVHGVWGRNRE